MTNSSKEKKADLEPSAKSAQKWLNLRRSDPAADLTEQELKGVSGGDGPPSTAGDGNGRVHLRRQTS
jgi:hypothetical protein